MPWHIARSDRCPTSRPYAVIKDDDGAVQGCHPSRESAKRQLAALNAKENAELDERVQRALAKYRLPDLEPGHHIHRAIDAAEDVENAREQTYVQGATILTEIGDRTVLTAPMARNADLDDIHERATEHHPHYLTLTGNFVGGDKPNNNGALWSADDLERAADTVPYGPLNWLHEGRKVIGALTGAWFHGSHELAGPAGLDLQPMIKADAVAWRWLYPQETGFIEAAIEAGHAFYSMECIGSGVQCVDHGCGTFEYADAMRRAPNVCDHVRERSGTRRIIAPVFLGGAAIVPPARPGWPDATLMRRAAPLAEAAADAQGGIGDREWEQLMAMVVRFATG